MKIKQLVASVSDNSRTAQVETLESKDHFDSAASKHKEAFVSGALQLSEDNSSFHTVSQGLSESLSLESAIKWTSLEVLEQTPYSAHVSLPENEDAIATVLPTFNDTESFAASVCSSTGLDHHSKIQEASVKEHTSSVANSYKSTIETLSLHLPHLNNVKISSRSEKVSVTCYDYLDDDSSRVNSFSTTQSSVELQTTQGITLRQYLGTSPSKDVRLRLIIANDLSTDLIQCLGASFSMSPEIYEEHLVNAGWQNGICNDQDPNTWITQDMKKSYMSIKWYRPVKRVLQRPYSSIDRQTFLNPNARSFSWMEAVSTGRGKPRGVEHTSRPATNIFRQDWDMKTDGEAAISAGGFAAWEERATVWSKQCGGYAVAVLLLDPLPMVEDEMKGAADALQVLGVYHAETSPKGQAMNEDPTGNKNTGLSETDQPPKGLVKSSTFVRSRPKTNQNLSVMSLGRLLFGSTLLPRSSSKNKDTPLKEEPEASHIAEDPESGEQDRERGRKIAGIRSPRARNRVPKIFNRLFGRQRKKTDNLDGAKEIEVLEEVPGTEIRTLKPMNRCMFEGLYPRGPAIDYDFLMDPNNVHLLAEHLDRTKSTAANLAEWLTHNDRRRPFATRPTTHLEHLFAIIHGDTVNTLRHMELTLQEIGQHILDDTLIQQRLIHWRLLLERFGTELQQLEESLRRFAGFITATAISYIPYSSNEETPVRSIPSVEILLEDSISQINSLRQHTTRSHKSLMANMSIVESKRGIAEAESVTKLTELAFFFIPLTFSASIFSMQVKELNASRISIAAFFILAIIITTASYALRLLLRSENFIDLRRKTLSDIRHDSGLASGSPIPTTVFLAWLWRRVGLLSIIVTFLVVLLVTPIAILWTRDLNHGFKVLLTILLLGFILSWVSNRWTLFGLVVTGVGAGPAAALWTSQLTMGIKVGVTIVITMLYVGAIASILLYAIWGKRKTEMHIPDET